LFQGCSDQSALVASSLCGAEQIGSLPCNKQHTAAETPGCPCPLVVYSDSQPTNHGRTLRAARNRHVDSHTAPLPPTQMYPYTHPPTIIQQHTHTHNATQGRAASIITQACYGQPYQVHHTITALATQRAHCCSLQNRTPMPTPTTCPAIIMCNCLTVDAQSQGVTAAAVQLLTQLSA
jgi:hypothetical protein